MPLWSLQGQSDQENPSPAKLPCSSWTFKQGRIQGEAKGALLPSKFFMAKCLSPHEFCWQMLHISNFFPFIKIEKKEGQLSSHPKLISKYAPAYTNLFYNLMKLHRTKDSDCSNVMIELCHCMYTVKSQETFLLILIHKIQVSEIYQEINYHVLNLSMLRKI